MINLNVLTTSQLTNIIAIREQIEKLQGQIDSIAAGGEVPTRSALELPKKRRMSAAGRARIAAGARARWARIKGTAATVSKPAKKRRKVSAAVKARLAAIARARWAKVKAAGKKTL
jgi:hypothetical protein